MIELIKSIFWIETPEEETTTPAQFIGGVLFAGLAVFVLPALITFTLWAFLG